MSTDDPKRDDESKRDEGKASAAEDAQDKAARIAALEAELAALRGGDSSEASKAGKTGKTVDSGEPLDIGKKGGAKAIIVAVVVLGIGLTLIFGLFSTLAKGFDAFADKAAKRLTPAYEDDQPQTIGAKPLRGAKSVKLKKSPSTSSPVTAPTSPASAPASTPATKPPSSASKPAPKVPPRKQILLPGL